MELQRHATACLSKILETTNTCLFKILETANAGIKEVFCKAFEEDQEMDAEYRREKYMELQRNATAGWSKNLETTIAGLSKTLETTNAGTKKVFYMVFEEHQKMDAEDRRDLDEQYGITQAQRLTGKFGWCVLHCTLHNQCALSFRL